MVTDAGGVKLKETVFEWESEPLVIVMLRTYRPLVLELQFTSTVVLGVKMVEVLVARQVRPVAE